MNQHTGIAIDGLAPTTRGRRPVSKHKQRVFLAATLLLTDLVAIFLGLALASMIRFGHVWTGLDSRNILAIAPFYVISAVAVRALSGEALIRLAETLKRGMLALGATASMLLYLLFATQDGDQVSRVLLTLTFACAACMLLILRPLHVYFARHHLGGELYSVLVLNDGVFPASLGGHISINVSGRFDAANPSAEDYDRLAGLLVCCDRVVVRCTPDKRDLWAHVLQGMNVHAEIIAPEIAQTRALAISNIASRPTLVVARGPLSLRDRVMKRCFDLIVAVSALIALAPLLLLVSIAIKIDSPGPIMFKQKRIGRQNKLFEIYKFRTMYANRCNETASQLTQRNDSRVTRIGGLLRRTSVDELPQLLNVLQGAMSIVGPRPHATGALAADKLYWEVDQKYWHRHACKPGITGLAQVKGFRGSTDQEIDLQNRLDADLDYVANWSFWGDVAIIFKTLQVLSHKNAF